MNEQDTPRRLEAYADSIGRCERTPRGQENLGRRKSARRIVFMPLSAAALGVLVFAAWPRDASAATMKRLIHAIDNTKSMDSTTVYDGPSGKHIPLMRMSYESGSWRREMLTHAKNRYTAIFKNGLCYMDFEVLDHATVRTIRDDLDDLPAEGDALDMVKSQLKKFAGRSSVVTIDRATDVDGQSTYRVQFDRESDGRHVEIVVDRATDLPLSADTWLKQPQQHTHTDYSFNNAFRPGFFELKAGRKVIDLRKTIPARIATWQKPIASMRGFEVLDTQVTHDGTVWLVTKSVMGKNSGIMPQDLVGAKGEHYAGGISFQIPGQPIQIYGFSPLDKVEGKPSKCVLSLSGFSVLEPTSPLPDDATPAAESSPAGKLTFSMSSIDAALPAYLADLGLEQEILELQFWIDNSKASKLQSLGRYLEAGIVYERIGDHTSADFGAYEDWMKQAAACYQKAGSNADQQRVEQKLAHPDYSNPTE